MAKLRLHSSAEQVAGHLRSGIEAGEFGESMPGVLRLEARLGVNRKTIERALRLLESEGLLAGRGAGRSRRIRVPTSPNPTSLRIGILMNDPANRSASYLIELQRKLEEAGHATEFGEKALSEMGMDVARVERYVESAGRDAWIVIAGSRVILEWFAGRDAPAFALAGRLRQVAIAGGGPDKPPALAEAVRRLLELGHRRIVLLARPLRRLPEPGASERAFLGELADHGIEPGAYHLPDWEPTADGFRNCLESLFRATPPTALIVDEAPFFTAALQFCAERGIRVPEQVSLVSTDNDRHFQWCRPSVAHIDWDTGPVIRRVLRWASRVGRGEEDRRQTRTRARFVEGGTIAAVPGRLR